jgi:hypothetical protein
MSSAGYAKRKTIRLSRSALTVDRCPETNTNLLTKTKGRNSGNYHSSAGAAQAS